MRFSQLFSTLAVSLASASELCAEDRTLPELVEGRLLLSELGCAACHQAKSSFKQGPLLDQVGTRVQEQYLRDYLAGPHEQKPGTTMPDLLASYEDEEKKRIANALADFLLEGQEEKLVLEPIDAEAVTRGEALYHSVGCVACHDPEKASFNGSSPLVSLAEKYSVGSLTAFLEEPLKVRSSGRMPDMRLSHWESLDLSHYLLREQAALAKKGDTKNPTSQAKEGKEYYEKLGCVQCHAPEDASKDFATSLQALAKNKRCSQAYYDLTEREQKLIELALAAGEEKELSQDESIILKMSQMNCYACHTRDGLGGISVERDPFFTTSNLNLGEQGRIPPSLDGVGAKFKPAALRRILTSDGSVRPYMHTRMPRFGSGNVGVLVEWLREADKVEAHLFERVPEDVNAMQTGHQLVGDKGLACNACHTFFGETSTTLNALDLTTMWERLEEDWFHRYLRDPQSYASDTIMPSFWPNGNSAREEVLNGNADHQIDAIWQYLSKGQEARRPSGVRPEPIPYGPDGDEAVMLRRQYRGIGKRGIGVGYPSGINLAFDAENLSLGTIWRGNFAEMSPVWRGQGSGFVKEAGEGLVRFATGPGFAKLESKDAEWPVLEAGEKVPGFRLLGYSLDEKQRPTFRYQFADQKVTDSLLDSAEGPRLVRTLNFEREVEEGVYLRLMQGETLTQVEKGTKAWMLSEELMVSLSSSAILVEGEEMKELRIPLQGLKTLTLTYTYLPR